MAERECASHSFDGEAFYEGKAAEKVSHQRRKQLDTWMHKNRTDEFEYKQFLKKGDGGLSRKSMHGARSAASSQNAKTDASIGGGFTFTRLWPAFGRQSLVGSSGGYTSHASPRACGARLAPCPDSVIKNRH